MPPQLNGQPTDSTPNCARLEAEPMSAVDRPAMARVPTHPSSQSVDRGGACPLELEIDRPEGRCPATRTAAIVEHMRRERRTSGQRVAKSIFIKDAKRRFGNCARKATALTPGAARVATAPGSLSEGSPRSAMKSGTCIGSTPYQNGARRRRSRPTREAVSPDAP
jgi:hypothetical protein